MRTLAYRFVLFSILEDLNHLFIGASIQENLSSTDVLHFSKDLLEEFILNHLHFELNSFLSYVVGI